MAEGTRLQLSLTQVVAGALATTSAAVAASFIGVYGTIIGAAVMSVISTVGATVYEHSIHRSKVRLRDARDGARLTKVPAGVVARMRQGVGAATRLSGARGRLRAQLSKPAWWKAVGAVSALVFAIAIATITVVELAANKPMYALTTGGEVSSGGTSISRAAGGGAQDGGPEGSGGQREPGELGPGSGEDGTDGDGSQGGAPDEVTPTEDEGTSRGGGDTDSAPRDSEPRDPEEEGGEPDTGPSPDPPDEQPDEPEDRSDSGSGAESGGQSGAESGAESGDSPGGSGG